MQQKTQRPVQFEITEQTREAVARWIDHAKPAVGGRSVPSRLHNSVHCRPGSTRVSSMAGYKRSAWIRCLRHATLRRTKASLIYRRTKNLRAVQLLLVTPNWRARFGIWDRSGRPLEMAGKRKCSDWRQGRPSFQAVASRPIAAIRARGSSGRSHGDKSLAI